MPLLELKYAIFITISIFSSSDRVSANSIFLSESEVRVRVRVDMSML